MEERKLADRRRQEQSELKQQLSKEQSEVERLAEENRYRDQQEQAVHLKNELIGQVAELK